MPGCCVDGCYESEKKGVRLFKLPQGPKNIERRAQWIHNINRKDIPSGGYVCEKHFTPDQFENNRADNKRPLRWNAVPTIFSHNKKIPTHTDPLRISCDKTVETIKIEIEEVDVNNLNVLCNAIPVSSVWSEPQKYDIIVEDVQNEEPEETNADKHKYNVYSDNILELERKLQLANERARILEEERDTLKRQLHKVFSADQIEFLKRGKMTGRPWKVDTIKKCLKIYLTCGSCGYEELRRQNYPLPSIRTLQRHIEMLKLQQDTFHDLFPSSEEKLDCLQ